MTKGRSSRRGRATRAALLVAGCLVTAGCSAETSADSSDSLASALPAPRSDAHEIVASTAPHPAPSPPIAATSTVETTTSTPAPPTVAETTAPAPNPPPPSPPPAPTTPPGPVARSFVVMATGDILTEQVVLDAAARAAAPGVRFDFGPLFAPIATGISSADLAICHMELPIGAPGARPGVYGRSPEAGNLLLAPHELAAGVAATGFDRCSTASNHTLDLGFDGVTTTLDALDAAGVGHAGTARTEAESAASMVEVLDVAGVGVTHLSYTRFSNMPRTGERWWMNFAGSVEQVAADVLRARAAGAEVVILSLHIAREMQTTPTGYDRDYITELTATVPIDLVVQHGPHVIQPVEVVNGAVVFWSVGNLLSGMGLPGTGKYEDLRTLDGLIATVRFTEVLPAGTGEPAFVAETISVLVCSERNSRTVYPPISVLTDPSLPDGLRAQMEACVTRSLAVQPDLS